MKLAVLLNFYYAQTHRNKFSAVPETFENLRQIF